MDVFSRVRESLALVFVLLVLAVALPATAYSQQNKDIRNYVFGNSLINHPTETNKTNVPYWLSRLAKSAGRSYAVDGQWGFLRNFVAELPPEAQWHFPRVNDVWSPERQSFADAGFNTILLNPANFIQYQPPSARFDGDNPDDASPLTATLAVFDWVAAQSSDARFYIYEGWADMGTFGRGFPPSGRAYRKYLAYNAADYHDWYVSYADEIRAARPDLHVTLIPVAAVLAGLLQDTDLAGIPITELYTDDAPHGTETLYFLASLITYRVFYGENAPEQFVLPEILHPVLRDNYADTVGYINTEIGRVQAAISRVTNIRFVASQDQADGIINPSLAMGLNGISDWSTQQPFIDIMKTARPWVGHLPRQWGGWEAEDLEKGGYLDVNGWPKSIPDELTHLETFILTDQPKQARSLIGRYRLTYAGQGKISLGGRAKRVSYGEGEIWFSYTPGEDLVGISIKETDPEATGDYIRDISVVREDQIGLFEVGAVFNPRWTDRIRDLRVVRFMDWMRTNGSEIRGWGQRPQRSDYTYGRRGVPVEVMVQLANELGIDPWFNMPHLADDEFSENFAGYVYLHLDPRLKAYVEYSNEMWNFIFPQAHWAGEQARARWDAAVEDDGWIQFAGLRAAEVAQVWKGVFGAEAEDRLVRVVATHTDWPGLEKPLLQGSLWEGPRAPPSAVFDAYAVSGYVGHELGAGPAALKVLQWIAEGTEKAAETATSSGWSGPRHRLYVAEHRFDLAVRRAAEEIMSGSLAKLLTDTYPYQAEVAARNGLELVMYEGGTHVVGAGENTDNETLTKFFTHFSYTPEMAAIYQKLLTGWRDADGTLFNAFVDVAAPGKFGSWGGLRHLDDSNPRWDVLAEFNGSTPAWWSEREGSTFVQGVMSEGLDVGETLTGTPEEDTFLGRGGDDILVSNGGADYLHGGAGWDRAVLPGSRAAYDFSPDGAATLATGPLGVSRLFSVEEVSFADQPDVVIAVSGL
ncbi:MAG: calcium-binding protein [Rhodobacteraceae bacterium]|nr:calcium-binding protein [Paracoccaceae bacterium]